MGWGGSEVAMVMVGEGVVIIVVRFKILDVVVALQTSPSRVLSRRKCDNIAYWARLLL